MNTIPNISGDGWFAVAGVYDAFVTFDVYLDVLFAETAPIFLDEREQPLSDFGWCVASADEMFVKEMTVSFFIEFGSNELWVNVVVG